MQGDMQDITCGADARAAMHAGVEFLLDHELRADGELLETLTVIQRQIDAVMLKAVRDFDASGRHEDDGAPTAASWMRAHLNLTGSAAAALVTTARRVTELPAMSGALDAGAISREHVQVVTRAMKENPARAETIAAAERTFADAARQMDPARLSRVVKRWACAVDQLGVVENEKALHEQRCIYASRTLDGAVAINGILPPEAGATVMAALEALNTEEYRACPDDERTPAQRRADALIALSRRYLDSGDAPVVGGIRPHLLVTVPGATFTAGSDAKGLAPAELEGVGPISTEAARRIGCDAMVTAVRVDAEGMPMGYGRRMRTVPPTLRKVIAVRDRGCVFPGCDRPPGWCQAHHLVYWSDGGRTDAENLALFCTHHHHAMHEGGFTVRGSPQRGSPETGGLRFYRPDGTRLIDRDRMPRRE